MKDWPRVSVIMPMRNEAGSIGACLDSLLANDYPHEKLEIVIADGLSGDRSREIVQGYSERYPFIKLVDNPKKITPVALNIAIRNSTGDVVVRVDAHSTYASDYIRQCVELLETTGAANVGGVQRAVGHDLVTNAIALATTSRFGVGDAKFRYSDEETYVDTVYLGAWRKETLDAVGGFDESWIVNQDYELNYRIRERGGRILLSPKIKCEYHVRSSLAKLVKQYFRYGKWKVKTLVAHPKSLCWRQMIPPAMVLAMVVSAILQLMYPHGFLGLLAPAAYVVGCLLASLIGAYRAGIKYLFVLPVVFAAIHFSWGIGFLFGLAVFGIPGFSQPRKATNSPDPLQTSGGGRTHDRP